MKHCPSKIFCIVATSVLIGCGEGSGGGISSATPICQSSDAFACSDGSSEPLFTYQWALDSSGSYFASYPSISNGLTDILVNNVHRLGIKGSGIKIVVLDGGIEIEHEDLFANVSTSLTWNFLDGTNNPTPISANDYHGTLVSGIIGAAQNGYGIMGVAARATMGGANYLLNQSPTSTIESYGGASWSRGADIINASYGNNGPNIYSDSDVGVSAVRNLQNLRGGKGILMAKAGGNSYQGGYIFGDYYTCPLVSGSIRISSCSNPAYDIINLQPNVIVVSAATAFGNKASYSSAGPTIWVSSLGGAASSIGNYGEAGTSANENGPYIYSTDQSGCDRGISQNDVSPYGGNQTSFIKGGTTININSNLNKNGEPSCNYASLTGTSAATPLVSGVIALMLEVNPKLNWRDVREILARSADSYFDPDYASSGSLSFQVDLRTFTLTNSTSQLLVDGSFSAKLDYGWQKNSAGYRYSTWYGFGLVNAARAVSIARNYYGRHSSALSPPLFSNQIEKNLDYCQVKKIGNIYNTGRKIDAIQINITSPTFNLSIGNVGFYLKSPSGMVSVLQTPNNIFKDFNYTLGAEDDFVLSTYAYYGETGSGPWEIFTVSTDPDGNCGLGTDTQIRVSSRIINIQ